MMKHLLPALLFLLCLEMQAQVAHGGEPFAWTDKTVAANILFERMPSIDRAALAAEDAVQDQYKEAPYRFGVEHQVNISPNSEGTWTIVNNGAAALWQFGLECPGALSINLIFGQYNLPKGAQLFVWSTDREEFIGAFTEKNNSLDRILATTVLQSDRVVVELMVPVELREDLVLELTTVVHGYRPVLINHFAETSAERGPYGSSGSCNNNVNCPVGADWQVEKRSVALIVEGGTAICTGALVNNTANDGTPYFLTANHCYSGSAATWVFVFNHESATCNGINGPTNQTVSGAALRARNANSDFCLLELNNTPPASYNVQYAGWDATDNPTGNTSAVGIHHPSGDLKKISFEDDPVTQATWGFPTAQVWQVEQWDDGITEGGSSGSPLFNQDHRIIGQLYGGLSACSGSVENGQGDEYGRFGVSWDAGSSSASRLREWLDPSGTGALVIDGFPDGFVTLPLDASPTGVTGVNAITCEASVSPSVTIVNRGSDVLTSLVITYTLNGGAPQTVNWSGSLQQNASASVSLGNINTSAGNNNLVVTVSNPNGSADQQTTNDSFSFSFSVINTGAGLALPSNFGFNQSNWPYTGWQVENPDAADTWTYVNTTSQGGTLWLDYFNYDAEGQEDNFITPSFSLAAVNEAYLRFEVAYAQYSNTYSDSLEVSVSTSCSGPWTTVYFQGGADLATAGTSTSEFSNPTAAQFRTECVDLSSFAGESSLFVRFTGHNGYGNSLFVDNIAMNSINCSASVGDLVKSNLSEINVFPNPSNDATQVSFILNRASRVQVEVLNVLGERILLKEVGALPGGRHNQWLDTSMLADGMYLLNVRVNEMSNTSKLIVRH